MLNLILKVLRQLNAIVFTFLEIVISLLLSVVIFPPIIISVLANEIVRFIVAGCLRIKFGSTVKLIADGTDNMWSFKTFGNSRTTLCMLIYKDQLEIESYQELFHRRVINHETSSGFKPYLKLTHKFAKHFGYFCWEKDESFNIKNHIRYYPGSEEKVITESELMEKILPQLFVDLKDSAPQWEEVIIPKFQYNVNDEEARKLAGETGTVTVKIFRYHHAYMDGGSNILMWIKCMLEGEDFPYAVNLFVPSKIPLWKRTMYKLSCILLGATSIIKTFYVSKTISNRFVTKNYTGKRVLSWTSPFDIDLLNEIRTKTKYSLPVIIAAAVGGALKKLDRKYPCRKEEFKNIGNEIFLGLVAMLLPYPNFDLRNRFTVVHYPINVSDISGLQRLQLANKEMQKLSQDPICYINFVLFKIFGRFPNFVIHHLLRDTGVPIIFSNSPVAKRNVKFWDNEVVECAAWPPLLLDTGLGILPMSYSGHMRVCGVADEACLSENELKYFLTEVHNEVRLMFEECLPLKGPQEAIIEAKLLRKIPIPAFENDKV